MPVSFTSLLISSSFSVLFCWTLVSQWFWTQTRWVETAIRISGTVSDADSKQPIAGAAVRIQRTRRGVTTDAYGNFALTALATDTVTFQALGYKPYQLVLHGASLSQLVVQVRLQRESIRLDEVRVTAAQTDRASINRALRNMKRPSLPVGKGPLRGPKPIPLFAVDSTPPPPPPTSGGPIGLLYDKFSRAGKERRKMEQIKVRNTQQKARQKLLEYNKAFKDNRGYE